MNPRPTDGIAHVAGYLFSNIFYQIDFLSMMCASAKISTDRIFTTETGEVVERHFFFDIPEIAGLTIDPSVNFPEPELTGSTLYVIVSQAFAKRIDAATGALTVAEDKLKALRVLLETQLLPIETLKLKLIEIYKAIPVDGNWTQELMFNNDSMVTFEGIYEKGLAAQINVAPSNVQTDGDSGELVTSESNEKQFSSFIDRDTSKDFYQAETTIPVPADITLEIKP